MKRILASFVVVAALFLGLLGPSVGRAQSIGSCSTVYLSDTGWSDPALGTWDPVTRTATLTSDLTIGSIEILSDSITLEGNGHALASCVYAPEGVVIYGRTGVTVRNLTVQGFWVGIDVGSGAAVTVANCIASGNSGFGIRVLGSAGSVLSGNTVRSGRGFGLFVQGAGGGVVSGNTIEDNDRYGLILYGSTNFDVAGNTMAGNRLDFVVDGDLVVHYEHNVAADNLVGGKHVYYIRNAVGQVFDGLADAGAFYCVNCNGVTVRNMTLAHGADGVCLVNTHNSQVENIRAQEAGYGVRLVSSNNNTIRDCTMTGNMYGLSLQGAAGNQVYGNWFLSNTAQAYVEGGSGNLFNLSAPIGGNYWSDWTGPDADGDGFVDSPYVFAGGQDDLPLCRPALADTDAPITYWSSSDDRGYGEWTTSDVRVTLEAVDIGASGVKGTEYGFDGATRIAYTGTFAVTNEGVTTVYYRSSDNAGNVEQVRSGDVRIDRTPPAVTRGAVQGVAGNNGWYLSDVTIPYTASDALSGLGNPADASFVLTASGEGEHIAANEGWGHRVYDRVDNETWVGGDDYFNIDKTAPVLTQGAVEGVAGKDGWYRSDVTVAYSAADGVSGLASAADASFTLTASGEGESVSTGTREVADVAGNVAMAGPLTFKIDKTPPVVIGAPTTQPNAAGWHKSDVTIHWTATDAVSGVDPATLPPDSVIGGEGSNLGAGPVATADRAGNTSAPATVSGIRIDRTPPAITIATSQPDVVLPAGTAIEFAATDALSGIATVSATLDDGRGPVPVSSGAALGAGVYTLAVQATDQADNTASETRSFVVYDPNSTASGKGWVDSPRGAYPSVPPLTDRASFGFQFAYASGATVPSGQAQFELKAAGLNFCSTGYEWLVVTGAKAQCKGVGTINDEGDFGFLFSAIDGKPDRIRVKIWDNATGVVEYDSQLGAADNAEPATALGGGSIVVHAN